MEFKGAKDTGRTLGEGDRKLEVTSVSLCSNTPFYGVTVIPWL
jgi:hypothetical protein